MTYRIHDFATNQTWFTEDDALAIQLSYESDRYDVEPQDDEIAWELAGTMNDRNCYPV